MLMDILRHRHLGISVFRQYIKVKKNQIQGHGRLFSVRALEKYKTSDTLFVMGSGPSICDYSADQFSHIRLHDSFGFTNWTMHDHVPTFYMNEFKAHTEELSACQEQEVYNLAKRSTDYAETALIFRAGSTDFSKIPAIQKYGFPFENVFLAIDLGVLGNEKESFMRSFEFFKKSGILDNNYLVAQKTASLFRIAVLAYKLGYTRVVLCGIDLTGDQYFFERERERYASKDLMFPVLTTYRNKTHKTNDPAHSTGQMIVSELLVFLNEALYKPNGIEMFVGSNIGALYPTFPLYHF